MRDLRWYESERLFEGIKASVEKRFPQYTLMMIPSCALCPLVNNDYTSYELTDEMIQSIKDFDKEYFLFSSLSDCDSRFEKFNLVEGYCTATEFVLTEVGGIEDRGELWLVGRR